MYKHVNYGRVLCKDKKKKLLLYYTYTMLVLRFISHIFFSLKTQLILYKNMYRNTRGSRMCMAEPSATPMQH